MPCSDLATPEKRLLELPALARDFVFSWSAIGLAWARPLVMSETGENAGLSTTAAGFVGDEGVSLACTACTASRPTPVATSAGGEDGRDLRADPHPAGGDASADRAAPEEGAGERSRERHGAQVLERGALGPLTAFEDGAVLAFAQVGAQSPSLRARQSLPVEARERELGLLAGEPAFELLAERAAGAEDKGFDGTDGEVEDLGDLGVRASLELAHDERGALVEGEEAEGPADLTGGRDVVVLGRRGGEAFVELDLLRAARRVAEALPADVVRDLDQPVVRAIRALAALERAVGAEERRLGDVLRVGLVVQDRERVAVDGMDVPLVELLEGAVSGAL